MVWPYIRRERLCRTGANASYELEFVDWGASKVPSSIHPHFTRVTAMEEGGRHNSRRESREQRRSVSSLGDYGILSEDPHFGPTSTSKAPVCGKLQTRTRQHVCCACLSP